MSHFSNITTEITDIEICKDALKNMGLKLQENGICRYYYGSEQATNVVYLPGKYDFSLEKKENDSYDIKADFFGGEVEKYIGKQGGILIRNYGIEKLKKEVKKKHFSITSKDKNTFKVRDPQDPNGGYMIVTFDEEGNVEFTPKGIKGKNCSKFLSLEDSLGNVTEREFLKEFYSEEKATVGKVNRKERIRI